MAGTKVLASISTLFLIIAILPLAVLLQMVQRKSLPYSEMLQASHTLQNILENGPLQHFLSITIHQKRNYNILHTLRTITPNKSLEFVDSSVSWTEEEWKSYVEGRCNVLETQASDLHIVDNLLTDSHEITVYLSSCQSVLMILPLENLGNHLYAVENITRLLSTPINPSKAWLFPSIIYTITLANPDPSTQIIDWEPKKLRSNLKPLLKKLEPIMNIELKFQTKQYLGRNLKVHDSTELSGYDLKLCRSNQNGAPCYFIAASDIYALLKSRSTWDDSFLLNYRSGEIVSSYSVQDESGEAAAILLNPTNNKMQKLSDSDNKRLLNIIFNQIRGFLGLRNLKSVSFKENRTILVSRNSSSVINDWEIAMIARGLINIHLNQLINNIQHNLWLVDNISRIPISQSVVEHSRKMLTSIHDLVAFLDSCQWQERGCKDMKSLFTLTSMARDARVQSDLLSSHPDFSLQPHFPDNFVLSVHAPLLVPLLFSLGPALYKISIWWRNKRMQAVSHIHQD